jgi:hypothetical protein
MQNAPEVGRLHGVLAEAVRFELTDPFESPVFKTGAIDHSATLPWGEIVTASQAETSPVARLDILGACAQGLRFVPACRAFQ